MSDDETGPRVYDRDVLYREVWADPVRTVAARYGVSDVALAKTCRRLQVPLPGRGYWSKQKAGIASPPPPLPKLREGVEPVIVIDDIWGRRAGVPLVAPKPAKPTPRTVVPDTLRNPHPLVATTRDLLKGPGPRDEFVSCREQACLTVAVSRGARGRALRLMDVLLKAMEAQGYVVEVVAPETRVGWYGRTDITRPGITRVLVGEDWIHFSLAEKRTTEMRTHRGSGGYTYERRDYVPTGRLSLALENVYWIASRKTWNDGKRQRLEDCLDEFIDYLPLVAAKLAERRLESERTAAIEREKARLRQEAEERRLAEEARREKLLAQLERWRLAHDIRAYVAEAAMRGVDLDPEASWALGYADTVDPLGPT